MIELDPAALAAAIALCEPLNIRTIAFGLCTFDLLKGFQRKLESCCAETPATLKY